MEEVRERTEAEAMTMAFTASEQGYGGRREVEDSCAPSRPSPARPTRASTTRTETQLTPTSLRTTFSRSTDCGRTRRRTMRARADRGAHLRRWQPWRAGGARRPFLLLWVHASYKLLNKGTQDEGLSRMKSFWSAAGRRGRLTGEASVRRRQRGRRQSATWSSAPRGPPTPPALSPLGTGGTRPAPARSPATTATSSSFGQP